MTVLRNGLLVPQRYSNRFSSNPFPLNGLVFYADLWNVEQQGVGTLTNGTGVATPTSLGAGANTVTVATEGTFTIWLPDGHTGTAASGTATVTGSPVSLSGNNNTITVVGTGTITVTCTDQVVDRSTNAALCTVTGATWSNQGRTCGGAADYITVPYNSVFNMATMTVGYWVYLTADQNACQMQMGDLSGSWVLRPEIVTQSLGIYDGTWEYLNTGYAIPLTTLTRIDLTFDSAKLVSWYVNGVLNYSTTFTKALPTIDNDLTIGHETDPAGFGSTFFNGRIGEAYLYNRALTAQEIQQNYLATKWRYV